MGEDGTEYSEALLRIQLRRIFAAAKFSEMCKKENKRQQRRRRRPTGNELETPPISRRSMEIGVNYINHNNNMDITNPGGSSSWQLGIPYSDESSIEPEIRNSDERSIGQIETLTLYLGCLVNYIAQLRCYPRIQTDPTALIISYI